MNNVLLGFLLSISAFLGSDQQPINHHWKITNDWSELNSISKFSAETDIANLSCSPGKILELPMIIHGAHQIYIDNKLLATYGDPTFKLASPFYLKPAIECEKLAGNKLTWVAYSYAQYFSRFTQFPETAVGKPAQITLFHEIFNIISGTGLLLLCFITSIIFYKKIPNDVFFCNILANLGFAMYFIFSCSNYFLMNISMLTAHKLADMGVWIAISSFFYILHDLKLVSKFSYKMIVTISLGAVLLIGFADDGDTIQFGTSLPFPSLILVLIEASFKSFVNLSKRFRENITRTASVLFFFFSGVYEIALVVGIVDSNPLLSIGILGALIAITLIVQSGISLTYRQRDELLNELESKVEARTKELRNALKEKESAQAELIQNAKLASLGTLSAGIAHEINNNINYVNACVVGLEREFQKLQSIDKTKIDKLISTIKHGTKMTIDIVNSLRNYTGLNQGKNQRVQFKEVVTSVTNIIKRKIEHIKIEQSYDETYIDCNVVALNQIVMNLLTNAVDALDLSNKQEKIIKISAERKNEFLEIRFSDNGTGIPAKIIDKIFDPFFTTKDVGSGTGLGLHIVKKEVDNHNGSIKIFSEEGTGTTFVILIPLNLEHKAAA